MTTATMSRLNFQGIEETGGSSGNNAHDTAARHNGADGGSTMNRRAALSYTTQTGQTAQAWLMCSNPALLEPLARALSRVDLHLPDTA